MIIRPFDAAAEARRIYLGKRAEAAEPLGIGRNTLWRKLKEYGVKASDESAGE